MRSNNGYFCCKLTTHHSPLTPRTHHVPSRTLALSQTPALFRARSCFTCYLETFIAPSVLGVRRPRIAKGGRTAPHRKGEKQAPTAAATAAAAAKTDEAFQHFHCCCSRLIFLKIEKARCVNMCNIQTYKPTTYIHTYMHMCTKQ